MHLNIRLLCQNIWLSYTRSIKHWALLFSALIAMNFSTVAFTQEAFAESKVDGVQQLGDYEVQYALFNSTFIQPDVAATYGLKRSKNESLLNISVYRNGKPGTISAEISGTSRNLIQQLKTLDIIEIEEKNAVYYLVPIRISGKELLHFDFKIQPENDDTILDLKFSKTVYAD